VKLGDIIQSTPTLVSTPAENYDVIYGDPTYRQFRKKHQYRRAVVYAGGNDGGLHAFNGGFYDRFNKQFLKAPPDDLQAETLSFTKKQYDLGAELWMYVPKNIFPHLRWLTDEKYGDGHVYYIDAKPYIFDAKIFNPDTNIHIGGWGTVLVAGMRYGGGNIGVNTDGVAGDDEIMRSSYFILDITDPEYSPVVLAEFTDADLGFTTGSPTAIPMLRCDKNTLAGIADCTDKSWPMDWYLAFGSGPHAEAPASAGGPQAAMRGVSDQTAQLYVMKLGGTGTLGTPAIPATLGNIGSGQVTSGVPTFATQPSLVAGYPISSGACSDFTSANEAACLTAGQVWNPVACQWIPGVWDTYTTEATCEGSGRKWDWLNGCYERISAEDCLASDGWWFDWSRKQGICSDSRFNDEPLCLALSGTWKDIYPSSFFGDFIAVDYDLSFQTEALYFGSVSDTQSQYGHESHGGALHRLVINDHPDPANWSLNLFYDAMSPVTAAPSVATDGERAWVYFGTGRLYSAKEDKKILTPFFPTMFLGLKEHYGDDGIMNLNYPNGGQLVDVTGVWVAAGGALSPTPITASNAHTPWVSAVELTDATGYVTTFAELNLEMDEPDLDATNGEKDIYHGWKIKLDGAERVIGQPAILGDVVTFTSYIPSNDPCLPEGDSYLWAPYFRTGTAYSRSVIGVKDSTQEVLRKIDLGKGLSTTPNIHTGEGDGSKAFVQSSTGAILSIEQTNPGVVKSGMKSWRELGGNRSCN
jgi:Tfp pilus tip-associated adhesin PilY1